MKTPAGAARMLLGHLTQRLEAERAELAEAMIEASRTQIRANELESSVDRLEHAIAELEAMVARETGSQHFSPFMQAIN